MNRNKPKLVGKGTPLTQQPMLVQHGWPACVIVARVEPLFFWFDLSESQLSLLPLSLRGKEKSNTARSLNPAHLRIAKKNLGRCG